MRKHRNMFRPNLCKQRLSKNKILIAEHHHHVVVTISNCNNFYRLRSRGYNILPHIHISVTMLVCRNQKFELDTCVVHNRLCVVQYVSQMKVAIILRF